ncbi:unnamed protein product [Arctogadus glacialis]
MSNEPTNKKREWVRSALFVAKTLFHHQAGLYDRTGQDLALHASSIFSTAVSLYLHPLTPLGSRCTTPPPHLTLLSLKIVLDSNVLFASFARTSVSSSPSVITSSIFALNALAGCAGRRLSSPLLLNPWKMPCGRAPLEPTFF